MAKQQSQMKLGILLYIHKLPKVYISITLVGHSLKFNYFKITLCFNIKSLRVSHSRLLTITFYGLMQILSKCNIKVFWVNINVESI